MTGESQVRQTNWQALMRLVSFARPQIVWFVLALASAIVGIGMSMLTPYLLQAMADRVVTRQMQDFVRLLALAGLLLVVDASFTMLGRRSIIRYTSRTIRDLRDCAVAHVQQWPIASLDEYQTGDLVSRLNADVDKLSAWLAIVPELLTQPLLFLAGSAYMLTISWKLLVASCVLIPFSALLFNRISKPMEDFARQQAEGEGQVNAALQDVLGGITMVKAFNLKSFLGDKFRMLVKNVERQALCLDRRRMAFIPVYLALRYTPQLIVPLYGGSLAFRGEITVGQLLAANLLIWTVFLPVERLLGILGQARETIPSAERVFMLLDRPTEPTSARPFAPVPGTSPVEFADVGFGYASGKRVLNGMSFRLAPGQTTALVGASGCGKSTLFKLLCGFYLPQDGRIRVYGNDLAETDLESVRAHISLVSQDTYLFPVTIAENIAYGRLGATEMEIVAAARAANAHEFILEQPEGYRTLVGERGVRLSGGQRQRIALARAILKDAPILLLDEPTSSLDAQSEAAVQEALERFMADRTVLIAAHRLSTIQSADQVLVLDEGVLREQGTHNSLIQRDTLYRRLYLKQVAPHTEFAGQEV